MTRSIFLSLVFHSIMIVITALSMPFMRRAPIDLPPILSVELIQITDKTNIPYAPKARELLEKINGLAVQLEIRFPVLVEDNVANYARGITMCDCAGGKRSLHDRLGIDQTAVAYNNAHLNQAGWPNETAAADCRGFADN